LEVTKVYDPYFGTTTSATHIVALEIDRETYKVKLNRYVVAAMRPSDQEATADGSSMPIMCGCGDTKAEPCLKLTCPSPSLDPDFL
jgi:hypothetical protein